MKPQTLQLGFYLQTAAVRCVHTTCGCSVRGWRGALKVLKCYTRTNNIIELKYYLFGKHGDVFVEGLRRAHVTARYAWIPGRARGKFAFFKY